MQVTGLIKRHAKFHLRNLLYRSPPIGLQPERLHLWLDILKKTIPVDGDVLEIGCNIGGTAAIASKMLHRLGAHKVYRCYDTFSGFVDTQFASDNKLGTPDSSRDAFEANSYRLALWMIKRHGGGDVRFFRGDIISVPDSSLPTAVSAGLLDVDLSEPTYAALNRIYPRLSPGGILLVDDCPEDYDWKARIGYEHFMREHGLQLEYDCGMGIVSK